MKVSPLFSPVAHQAKSSKAPQQPFESKNFCLSARIHQLCVAGLPWSSHFISPLGWYPQRRCLWIRTFPVVKQNVHPTIGDGCLYQRLLCSTKYSIDIPRLHLLLLAGFLSFPLSLLILKQNPALSSSVGPLFVKKVKQKVWIQEFKFDFLACLTLSLAASLEVLSTQEI